MANAVTPAIMINGLKNISLWESERTTFKDAIELSLMSLQSYGDRYRHWCIAYSGGKDSSATVSFVVWAIRTGQIVAPETLTVMYADTRQELPPLQKTAMRLLADLESIGIRTRVVLPKIDDRFYVYVLGRGVPPPTNTFRWCTAQLKIEPMEAALAHLRTEAGDKFLQITGVRMGESAIRDARISMSCSKDSGECGQGWFQSRPSTHVADTLAPLVHWRLCYVWDWLYFASDERYMKSIIKTNQPGHGFGYLADIAAVYGDDEARTGCTGCNLTDKDTALDNLIESAGWAHLAPLREIKPLLRELRHASNRLRKTEPAILKDGSFGSNVQRLGPLAMDARRRGLDAVLDIQSRARVDLINAEEEQRIRQMWQENIWPQGWSGEELRGDVPIDRISNIDGELIVQPRLL